MHVWGPRSGVTEVDTQPIKFENAGRIHSGGKNEARATSDDPSIRSDTGMAGVRWAFNVQRFGVGVLCA
jgi:hypothetical protein